MPRRSGAALLFFKAKCALDPCFTLGRRAMTKTGRKADEVSFKRAPPRFYSPLLLVAIRGVGKRWRIYSSDGLKGASSASPFLLYSSPSIFHSLIFSSTSYKSVSARLEQVSLAVTGLLEEPNAKS